MLTNTSIQPRTHRELPNNINIISISISPNEPAKWIDSTENEYNAACLNCIDQPCIRYNDKELETPKLNDFSKSLDSQVCATGAIKWDDTLNEPHINEDTCILCGICAVRCPTKAIYLTENSAKVSTNDIVIPSLDIEKHQESIDSLEKASLEGYYYIPTQKSCENALVKIESLNRSFENLLVRNLLNTLGFEALSYRVGVQYSAIDVIGFYNGKYIAVEVDLGGDSMLDTPRNLIASAALLFERHKWDREHTILISIGKYFPRNRGEFWEVIQDINKILNIKINFSSILALFFLLWLRHPFKIENNQYFEESTMKNNQSIRALIGNEKELKNIKQGYMAILETDK